MDYTKDAHVTIYQANLPVQTILDAVLKHRNPEKGIHVEYVSRTKLQDHRVRIVAPDFKIWREVANKMMKAGVAGNVTVLDGDLTIDEVKEAIREFHNPLKGIHVAWFGKNKAHDHLVRVIARNEEKWSELKSRIYYIKKV